MKKKTIIRIVYICIFLAISLTPVFAFDSNQKTIGNETKKIMPKLFAESGINLSFTDEADAYFSQNFGFRNSLVRIGSRLKAELKTSGNESVVLGTNDWLFYGSALDDFLGRNVLSDTQADKIAVSLLMSSDYVKSCGSEFIFISAPNKMSLYGEYMPYYYIKSKEKGNYEKVFERLNYLGAANTDLKKTLNDAKAEFDIPLYHKTDSHWNNLGAATAYESVMESLCSIYQTELKTKDYIKSGYSVVKDFNGDLESMLFPDSKKMDEQIKFNIFDGIVYSDGFKGSDDLLFGTTNPLAVNKQSLVLYRDSFGNALYWFFANDFEQCLFKREIPYNLYNDTAENDVIVAELVERNLRNLLTMPPVVPSHKMVPEDEKYLGAYRGLNNNSNDMIVDIYGNSPQLKEKEGTVICNTNLYQDELYRITMNYEQLDNYPDIYLMLFNSDSGITLYRCIPTGKECDATLFVEKEDFDYIINNRLGAYVIALDKDGNDVRIPVDFQSTGD